MLDKYIKRNSSVELLRLLSIWMIVVYHLSMHSFGELPSHSTFWDAVTNIFHIGVICFVLISGYFGIKASIYGALKLVVMCLFYSLLIMISKVLVLDFPITPSLLYVSVTPLMHEEWWFITSYVILYALSHFLNKLWQISTDKERKILITLLFGIMAYFGWIGNISTIHGGRDIITFTFLYFLGKLIASPSFRLPNYLKMNCLYVVISVIIIVAAMLPQSLHAAHRIIRFVCFGYNSPGLILMGVSVFCFFVQLPMFQNKWINYVSASVLPVYLLHENSFTYPLMKSLVFLEGNNKLFIFFGYILLSFLIVATCIIIDKLLCHIYTPISYQLSGILRKLPNVIK